MRIHTAGALRWMGAVLLANFLFIVAMAASPELHHHLHHDADDQSHDCAVVMVATGSVSAPEVALVLVAFARHAQVFQHPPRTIWVPSLSLSSSPLERGPPFVS